MTRIMLHHQAWQEGNSSSSKSRDVQTHKKINISLNMTDSWEFEFPTYTERVDLLKTVFCAFSRCCNFQILIEIDNLSKYL